MQRDRVTQRGRDRETYKRRGGETYRNIDERYKEAKTETNRVRDREM